MDIIPISPRYLQVAHWLLEHQCWMSARQMAVIFNVSHKLMCDDFAMIRQRSELFVFDEKTFTFGHVHARAMRITHIHPYVVDGRSHPKTSHEVVMAPRKKITWKDILTRPVKIRALF